MRVKMPLRMRFRIRRTLVKPHGVWEAGLKQVVVACGHLLQNICQGRPLRDIELSECATMTPTQHERLEWPDRPERHHGDEFLILANDSFRRLTPRE